MSEVAAIPQIESAPAPRGEARTYLAGIALVSFAALLLELALTRLFSVVLFYHFAFLAISVALLGLGAGGVFAYLGRKLLERWGTRALLARLALFNAAAILVALQVVLRTPVFLELSGRNFASLTAIYAAAAVPFFFTGVSFSVLFARERGRIAQLYGSDLAGGALACVAVVPLLNLVGGPNAVLFAAVAMSAAALLWSDAPSTRRLALAWLAVTAGLLAANYTGALVDIVYAKGERRDQPFVLFARWNAISRVEVNQMGEGRAIVIDADAATALMAVNIEQAREARARRSVLAGAPGTVNALRPTGEYAIIGPGGGVDVVRALVGGSPRVVGIEINPIIVNDIMRGRFADYVRHLYDRPEVEMHISDGRSWIRASRERYDVIQMTLVDTWASTAAGAFALSENNLYTVEAFREYFDHLQPDGMLAITRWEFREPREALRVVSQAMEALRRMGVSDARQHFVVVAEGPLVRDGIPVTVLAKKSPFTAEEERLVYDHLALLRGMQALYLPSRALPPEPAGARPRTPGPHAFAELLASGSPNEFARVYPYNVSAVGDDAPFFFFTLKPAQLWKGSELGGIDWKVNMGVAVLAILLGISVLAVTLFLVLPLALRAAPARGSTLRLLYFIAVGLGYILVEIAFIQRFVLFLGHPTYALTVVVFLMLLSSGAGSWRARRWMAEPLRVRLALATIVAAILLDALLLPWMLRSLVGLAFPLKLGLSAAVLAPLAFVMGMPFPTGLRVVASSGEETIEWAWAMNAAATVLGSVLAMGIAIQFGLTAALLAGAVAYLAAALLTWNWRGAALPLG